MLRPISPIMTQRLRTHATTLRTTRITTICLIMCTRASTTSKIGNKRLPAILRKTGTPMKQFRGLIQMKTSEITIGVVFVMIMAKDAI